MEARKITIVATNVQKKYVLNSTAETLGELMEELDKAGVSYKDMTFMEGLTRTEMKDSNSLLPTNVKKIDRATGEETTTNELVFMLTNTEKKIKSGAMSRTDAYNAIKKNNLQVVCIARYGKNFTQCSTESLIALVQEFAQKEKAAEKKPVASSSASAIPSECVDSKAREALECLVDILYYLNVIEGEDKDKVVGIINSSYNVCNKKQEVESPYSDDEIDEMFKGMK